MRDLATAGMVVLTAGCVANPLGGEYREEDFPPEKIVIVNRMTPSDDCRSLVPERCTEYKRTYRVFEHPTEDNRYWVDDSAGAKYAKGFVETWVLPGVNADELSDQYTKALAIYLEKRNRKCEMASMRPVPDSGWEFRVKDCEGPPQAKREKRKWRSYEWGQRPAPAN